MLTASHNPPEYHGIKFIPEFAGPALPEETEVIEANGNTVLASGKIKRMDKEKAQKKDLWHVIDPLADYTRHLLSLVHEEQIRGECLKIIVDPLYGAGMGYVESVLRGLGCRSESIHNYRDVFSGSMPDRWKTTFPS